MKINVEIDVDKLMEDVREQMYESAIQGEYGGVEFDDFEKDEIISKQLANNVEREIYDEAIRKYSREIADDKLKEIEEKISSTLEEKLTKYISDSLTTFFNKPRQTLVGNDWNAKVKEISTNELIEQKIEKLLNEKTVKIDTYKKVTLYDYLVQEKVEELFNDKVVDLIKAIKTSKGNQNNNAK